MCIPEIFIYYTLTRLSRQDFWVCIYVDTHKVLLHKAYRHTSLGLLPWTLQDPNANFFILLTLIEKTYPPPYTNPNKICIYKINK